MLQMLIDIDLEKRFPDHASTLANDRGSLKTDLDSLSTDFT